jgi:hypothetical protein
MIRCPHCFSKDQVNLSRFRGLDAVLTLLLLRPYRCRLCQTRFFARLRFRGSVPNPTEDSNDALTPLRTNAGQANETTAPT